MEHLDGTFDVPVANTLQHLFTHAGRTLGQDVHEFGPVLGKVKTAGTTIIGTGTALNQALLFQAVQQSHQRRILNGHQAGELTLGQPFAPLLQIDHGGPTSLGDTQILKAFIQQFAPATGDPGYYTGT